MSKANMGRGVGNSGDSKKLRIFRQPVSGVSRALWPANMRRSPATGWVAQRRRYLLLSGKWWAKLLTYTTRPTFPNRTFLAMRNAPVRSIGLLALLAGSSILAALFFHIWLLLLLPTALLTMVSLAIVPSLLTRVLQIPRTNGFVGPRELRSIPGFPSVRRFPDTPMPTTPLVRELETFDLSRSDVEHFLQQERNTGGHRFYLENEDTESNVKPL